MFRTLDYLHTLWFRAFLPATPTTVVDQILFSCACNVHFPAILRPVIPRLLVESLTFLTICCNIAGRVA